MLIAEMHLFKMIENYFTDPLLNQDPLEAAEDPSPEDSDSSKEAVTEPEAEYLWEINSLVTSIYKFYFNAANVEDKWFINEKLDLAYLSASASDFIPSDISTDVDRNSLSAIDVLTSLHDQ